MAQFLYADAQRYSMPKSEKGDPFIELDPKFHPWYSTEEGNKFYWWTVNQVASGNMTYLAAKTILGHSFNTIDAIESAKSRQHADVESKLKANDDNYRKVYFAHPNEEAMLKSRIDGKFFNSIADEKLREYVSSNLSNNVAFMLFMRYFDSELSANQSPSYQYNSQIASIETMPMEDLRKVWANYNSDLAAGRIPVNPQFTKQVVARLARRN